MSIQKTAVVTGASSGIGFATCERLVASGWHVFGTVRRPEDAARLEQQLGESCTALLMDVTDSTQIAAAAQRVEQALDNQKLGALVNNAGIAIVGPMLYMSVEEFRRQLDVNLVGVFEVTQAFMPLLGTDTNRVGTAGKIINISSVAGKQGSPFSGAYAASKHGLEGMSECLRQELMMYGIDVVIVGPGVIDTPIWDKNLQQGLERLANTDYGSALQEMMSVTASYVKNGYPPERVATVIEHILRSPNPAVRYPVMARRWLNWTLLRLVPKRWLDRIIVKRLKMELPRD